MSKKLYKKNKSDPGIEVEIDDNLPKETQKHLKRISDEEFVKKGYTTTEPIQTCSICKKKFFGFGNNPQPVKTLSVDDRCCDDCNKAVVIPRRFREVNKEIN